MEIVDLTDDNDVINNVIHDSNKFVNLVDDDSDVDVDVDRSNSSSSSSSNSSRKRSLIHDVDVGVKESFLVVTINIDDLTKEKVKKVIENISRSMVDEGHEGSNPDIIFIQETKVIDEENVKIGNGSKCIELQKKLKEISKEMDDLGYILHHHPILSKNTIVKNNELIALDFKHGNCCIIRKDSKLKEGCLEIFDWDLEGRVVLWKCQYAIFIAVHAATPNMKPEKSRKYKPSNVEIPKRYEHREEFDKQIEKYISDNRDSSTVILLGDFNCSLLAIDSSAELWEGEHYENCRLRHNTLKKECNLVDIWRIRNPKEVKRYTSWINHLNPPSQARIDMILVPQSQQHDVQYIEIMDNSNFCYEVGGLKKVKHELNHVPVVMKISLSSKSNKRVARG